MKLSGGYNSILFLLTRLDKEFKEDYKKVTKNVPLGIVERCNKCKVGEYSNDEGVVVSINEYKKEGLKQFDFDYINPKADVESLGMSVLAISKDALYKIPEYKEEGDIAPLIFRMNYLIKDKEESEYTFEVRRIKDRRNIFEVVMKKNLIINERESINLKTKSFTVYGDDLLENVRTMGAKR